MKGLIDEDVNLRVINLNGQQVFGRQFLKLGQEQVDLNLSALEAEVYILDVASSERKQQLRIVIQ